MKPDVSAVVESAPFPHRRVKARVERMAEQACIAYAIQVVEGMRCYRQWVEQQSDDPSAWCQYPCTDIETKCDRCTTLAQLREEQKP